MHQPQTVSRNTWRAARAELLVKEKELAEARAAVTAERRRLPMVEVDQAYDFEGPTGRATLTDLFDGRRQLIVYHFMWLSKTREGCPHCSFAADNIGHIAHLRALDTAYALVSRAPIADIEAFRKRMGWDIPWYSSAGSDFNQDFGVLIDGQDIPGISVFWRDGDTVFQTYAADPDGGVDVVLNTYNYLDMTPLGRPEEMDWIRHHDRYMS